MSAHPQPGYREDQRAFFDETITRDWDTYTSPLWDATRRFEIDQIFRYVGPKTVLDVGCGCGYHDVLIAQQPSVEEVEGVDYSAESIRVAEHQYPHSKVRRRVADVFAIDECDREFDLVASFQVIEHLRDQRGFLVACAQRTRPGGWVAIATPNRWRLDNRIYRALGRDEVMIDPMHFRELSKRELESLAADAGLRAIASFGYGLALTIPRLDGHVVPPFAGIRLGHMFPAIANVMCVIFERGR